jgi:hypothetical protein
MHLQLARVVRVYGRELDALEQLSFHCVWHGMRLLQPDCEGVHTFRMWLRDWQFEWNRLCLEKLEAPARVNLPDVLQHLSFVFGAFLGVRLATPLPCVCGSLGRLRLLGAKHHAAPDATDVGCGLSEVDSDSGDSDSSTPPALASGSESSRPQALGVASLDGGSEWGDTDESSSDSVAVEWFAALAGNSEKGSSAEDASSSDGRFGVAPTDVGSVADGPCWSNKCLQEAVVALLRTLRKRTSRRCAPAIPVPVLPVAPWSGRTLKP